MTDAMDMACRELVEVITDYLEGALAEDDRARFAVHLEECEACAAYVEQFRAVIRAAGRRVDADELDPELRAGLVAAFRGWANGG